MLLFFLNNFMEWVDSLYLDIFGCTSVMLILAIVLVVLIKTRKFSYVLCILLSIVAGETIEVATGRQLEHMDLKFSTNLTKYEEVVKLADMGLLTPDPKAGTSYTNPERSYQLPTEYYGLSDSHRIQITDTDWGRFVAFYFCGTLSRCTAYVYSSNPGMSLPKPFDWPSCRAAALGAYKNWSFCLEF